jgi:hypothetical protein
MIAVLLIAICVAGMALAVLTVSAVLIYEEKHGDILREESEEINWNSSL